MWIHVTSEIGRLRRVLIHRPGREIDLMVPSMMERLLFEDILYSSRARQEHDSFKGVLNAAGVETLDPQDLLADVLEDPELRDRLLSRLEERGLAADVLRLLAGLTPEELAASLVTGIAAGEDHPQSFYRLPPVPNYFFQRDPQVVLGDRVMEAGDVYRVDLLAPELTYTVCDSLTRPWPASASRSSWCPAAAPAA